MPRGVREQVPDRDGLAHLRVGDPELRQDLGDGGVEGQLAPLDEHHDLGGGPHLGDRADLEERVGGHLHPGGRVEHAGGELVDLPLVQEGQARAGNLVFGDQLSETGVPSTEIHCSSHSTILSL